MPRRRATDRRRLAAARPAAPPQSAGDGARQPPVDLAHAGSPRTQLAREAAAANNDVDAELWEVRISAVIAASADDTAPVRASAPRGFRNIFVAPREVSRTHECTDCATALQVLDICEDAELEEIHNILYGAHVPSITAQRSWEQTVSIWQCRA